MQRSILPGAGTWGTASHSSSMCQQLQLASLTSIRLQPIWARHACQRGTFLMMSTGPSARRTLPMFKRWIQRHGGPTTSSSTQTPSYVGAEDGLMQSNSRCESTVCVLYLESRSSSRSRTQQHSCMHVERCGLAIMPAVELERV
jgi:hypothetical protein